MEKKVQIPDTSVLKKALFNDPNVNFRIKAENAKRQFDKARNEGNIKESIPSQYRFSAFLK